MRPSPVGKGVDPLSSMQSTPPFIRPIEREPLSETSPNVSISYYCLGDTLSDKNTEKVTARDSTFPLKRSSQEFVFTAEPSSMNDCVLPQTVRSMSPGLTISPVKAPGETGAQQKGFKFSFDSAASKLSKYAQSAAYQIKVMTQAAANELRNSAFAHEVPVDVFDKTTCRSIIPRSWIDAFWEVPKHKAFYTRSEGLLFHPENGEKLEYTFPRSAFLSKIRLSKDTNKPTPTLFGGGGEMSAIQSISDVLPLESEVYITGRTIVTNSRFFFDPASVDTKSYTHRWYIESGLISVEWFDIESFGVFLQGHPPHVVSSPPGYLCDPQIDCGNVLIDLTLKSGALICFVLPSTDCLTLLESSKTIGAISDALTLYIQQHISPNYLLDHPAFFYTDRDESYLRKFEPRQEYARYCTQHEKLTTAPFTLTTFNFQYDLCPSYPKLLPLPVSLNEAAIRSIAGFRTRGRLPVLAWRSSQGACLWRCSQPQSAFSRNRLDEIMVCDHIQLDDSKHHKQRTLIFDARPFVNAVVNKITGAGYEDIESYEMCQIEFAAIENIQKVAESQASLLRALHKNEPNFKVIEFGNPDTEIQKVMIEVECCQPSHLLSKVFASGWGDHILTLLRAASRIARHLAQKEVVLVHCSDGWDRTTQLSALAQILVDRYFRTLFGFCVLVEKEFVWLGHKFGTRSGHTPFFDQSETIETSDPESSNKFRQISKRQVSPIFVQWLECVWQIQRQFPDAFEFGEDFLVALATIVTTSFYGDFVFNSESERVRIRRRGLTWNSIWDRINEHEWRRHSVPCSSDAQVDLLPLDTHVCAIAFWEAYWLRHWPRKLLV